LRHWEGSPALKLFNTLGNQLEEFVPLRPPHVGIYTCGPTVYHSAHIGNLRTYLFEDFLKRTLLLHGYQVRHVMNITDVGHLTSDADEGDDKLERGAAREGKSVWQIAEQFTQAFQEDLRRLHVLFPDIWCKATEHIQQQIDLIRTLEVKGFTYVIADGVYFDSSRLPDYGKLARLDREGHMAGARVEMSAGKRHPTDFALWKFSPKETQRQMEWESPWGVGFPGWHVECSAMATKYLGDQFDIHCGGVDHIPVHHTNEIAQSESALGQKPWVRYWLHGEFLILDKGKMSKSSGEFLTLQSLIDVGYDPLAYRYLALTAHYRRSLTFSWEALDGAQTALRRLRQRASDRKERTGEGFGAQCPLSEAYWARFAEALDNDLNTPQALAALWDCLGDDAVPDAEKLGTMRKMDEFLALQLGEDPDRQIALDAQVEALIAERTAARKAKEYARADAIRTRLHAMGIQLEDTPQGVRWKRV
jgi:cysteinyl-tRNA synthetase